MAVAEIRGYGIEVNADLHVAIQNGELKNVKTLLNCDGFSVHLGKTPNLLIPTIRHCSNIPGYAHNSINYLFGKLTHTNLTPSLKYLMIVLPDGLVIQSPTEEITRLAGLNQLPAIDLPLLEDLAAGAQLGPEALARLLVTHSMGWIEGRYTSHSSWKGWETYLRTSSAERQNQFFEMVAQYTTQTTSKAGLVTIQPPALRENIVRSLDVLAIPYDPIR